MQALSIWSVKSDPWVATHLDSEVSAPFNSVIKRRRKRLNLGNSLWPARCPGLLFVSSNLSGVRDGECCNFQSYDLGCRFFSNCSKAEGSLRSPVALAWALEDQEIASEVVEENSNSLDTLSDESGSVVCVHLKGVTKSGLPRNDDKHNNGDEGTEDVEELGEEKGSRVNVRALAWRLRSAKTTDDVEDVLKDKGDLPLQVYSSMIRGFGKDNRLDSAIALVEWLKTRRKATKGAIGPNLFIYNTLLGALKQAERYEEVERVMNDMALEGIHPNVVTYNTLMGIYLGQRKEVEALNLFEEIQLKGLSPSPASYSTALLAYRRLEDGFGALKFYVNLREKYRSGAIGQDMNEDWENEFAKLENFTVRICYQVMRGWLVKIDYISTNVLKLLTDMDKAGIQTGRAEHERLMWACTREEHHVVAKELYSRIRERDSEISLSICNHVIWLLGKAKKWWAALEIYEDLLDKGPKPNNMSYELIVSHFNTLLTAARKKGIWRWGVRLLNKMEEKGLKPGTREWNAVLVACSKASETSAAVEIFRRMVEQGEKPTVISYGALLSALEKGKLYDEALQVWKHMVRVGVEPNLYAYTIMASIHAGQGKFNIVDSIIREMVTTGNEPTVVTFNAIISACARNNMGGAAYEWFQRMKIQNVKPNEVTFEMLIEALANDGKPRLAYDLYLRAQTEGLNLSLKAYDAVAQSAQVYGATIDMSSLGDRPPETKKKVHIRKKLSEFCNLADVPRRGKPFDRKEIYTPQKEGNPQ
ncbi:hypothetical protein RJ639_020316 [Escallonia herrerae]|uniref:Pentatricopeptide repeat-containing protein n=1 Tax=Escallonia herrerae TaxID=1293975 RepID=A0AA88V5W0_9ASTE|nr:hypothetical protein RJ639_020316 [Escallonia herrerae]